MKLTKSQLKNIIHEALKEVESDETKPRYAPPEHIASATPEEHKRQLQKSKDSCIALPRSHPLYDEWAAWYKDLEPQTDPKNPQGKKKKCVPKWDQEKVKPEEKPTGDGKKPTAKAKRAALIKQVQAWKKEMADPATPAAKKRNLQKKIAGAEMDITNLGKQAAGYKTTADSHKLEPIYRAVQKQWNAVKQGTKDADLKKAMNYIQRIAIAELKLLREYHYAVKQDDPLSIKEIAANWVLGQKPYDEETYHGMYTVDELLEYRNFEWAEEADQQSPEEWNKLLQDVKEAGIIEPVVVHVGKNGQAAIAEGNHRLAVAQQVNIRDIPVKFVFLEDEVRKASKMTQEPAEIQVPAEEAHSEKYYIR